MAAPVSFSRWLAAAFAPLRKDIRIEHIGETQASILGIVKLVRQCVNALLRVLREAEQRSHSRFSIHRRTVGTKDSVCFFKNERGLFCANSPKDIWRFLREVAGRVQEVFDASPRC